MIWVILPAYNEEAAIEPLFARLAKAAAQMSMPFELILADDGSTDRTVERAEFVAAQEGLKVHIVQHRHNRGLGDTIKMGLAAFMQLAKPGDFACTMDCDNTQPPELIESMIALAQSDKLDIIVASRYQLGAAVKGLSQFRQTMSQGASALFRLFTPVPGLRDYTCGYRLYSYDFLRRLFEYYGESLFTERGFACMADLLLKSRALRPRVGEVAMVLRYDEKLSASKMKVARTIYQTLKLLAKHTVGTRHRPVRITYGADAVRRRPSGDRSPVMSGSERED